MGNTQVKNKGNKKGGNSNSRNNNKNNNKPTNARPQQNGKKSGRPCKHCQAMHMDYECPTLKKKNNHNSNNNNITKHQVITSKDGKAIICHHCQGNHYDSDCPNRKHDSSNGSFQQILIDNKSGKAISCKFCQGNHFNKNCPLKNPQNAGDTSMGNSPYNNNNTTGASNNRGGKDPKRPCKFCQGLHWDTECPSRGGNQGSIKQGGGQQQQGPKAPFIPKDTTQRLHPKEQQRIQNMHKTIQKWAPNHEGRGLIESFLQANFRILLDSNLWNEAFEQFLRETYIEFLLETYYNFLIEQVKNEEQQSYIYHFVLDSKQQLCDQDTPDEEFVLGLYFQSMQYRDYMSLVERKALNERFLQGGGQRSTTLKEAARADFNDPQFLNYIRNIGDNNQKAPLPIYTDIQRKSEHCSTGTRCEECGGAHSYGCCPRRQGHRSSWCCISDIESGDSFYSELEKSVSDKKTSDTEWYDAQEVVMTKKSMISEVEYEIDRAGDATMTEVDERCEICRSYLSVDEFGRVKDRWLYDLDHECVSSCERIAAGQHSDLIEKSHRMWDSPWAILGHVPQGSHVW